MFMDVDVEEIAEEFEDGEVLLVTAPSDSVQDLNQHIVKHFTEQEDALTVYVTVSKPSSTLEQSFKDVGVNTENLFYVDCATKLAGASKATRSENTIYLEPSKLTNISIALSEAVESLPDDRERLLIFDTLSTLMIYNDEEMVSKFAHTLTSKIRDWKIKSIILTLDEETDESVKSRLTQFADQVVELG